MHLRRGSFLQANNTLPSALGQIMLRNLMKKYYEDEKFKYIEKECYIYSFMASKLNDEGLEFIETGVRVIFSNCMLYNSDLGL